MRALGSKARHPARVYFTGGTTAVLLGWRETTIDVDLRFEPEHDELYRALPLLKESLGINIELASPSDFIPPLPGWEDRSSHISREGLLDFYHYDPYSQALAKIERGHTQDVNDVNEMLERGIVEPAKLRSLFEAIEPQLYRYPAIDPNSFAMAVRRFTGP
ncbi:MAG TPA: hypothetical protein PKD24_02815 [Pyrinomonadaceae bacterium]|nr:hypothetical protein [Pyrinomonadaceae bacterium]HMP64483.1 hypothetical protein [Pyrinomonadaceae bacterium]